MGNAHLIFIIWVKVPAKDIYHNAVKNALIKDGWTITAHSYPIKYAEVKLFADMTGEKTLAVSRQKQQLV
ncbi:MAG TPA: element excision factor XisH family protein [Nostoc sp.]|nr:element excision factor XisH family protein [Nostoc sp.]